MLRPTLAQAQDAEAQSQPSDVDSGLDDIVVTATKRGAQNVQDVPLAITAFGTEQLEAKNFRSLESLSYSSPNVQLDSIGSSPGFANFSIRGQGIANTQLTLEPTVGVFVDGVYQGVSVGIITNNFDLEGVEILRGPQGLLFGRNVTGGAVLLRTTKPTMTLSGNASLSIESGPNYTASAVVSGPIAENLAIKVGAYANKDEGYFTDDRDGTKVDDSHTFVFRGAILWEPSPDVELLIRAEHGENEGNGPAMRNPARYPRDKFKFANDTHGLYKTNWNQVTAEANVGVGFGDGTITNITAWRKLKYYTISDSDGTELRLFNAAQDIFQEQFSTELRYAGTFGPAELTTGAFYFWQHAGIVEVREIGLSQPPAFLSGGGDQRTETLGLFATVKWALSDSFKVNVGARYNRDTKQGNVVIIRAGGCNLVTNVCPPTYSGSKTWDDISPRVGFEWTAVDDVLVYGYWAKGFRSGGFPLRQTNAGAPRVPFNPESQNTFEIGFKGDLLDRKLRVNASAFINNIKGIQRAVTFNDPVVGTVQNLTNTADIEIKGFEAEVSFAVTPDFVLSGNVGYLDSAFKQVLFDVSGDGVINGVDFGLTLPRLAPWTYGASATYSVPLSLGEFTANVSYSHRDADFYDDANRAVIPKADLIDANLALKFKDTGLTASVYVKNLTNEFTTGINSLLPAQFGGAGAALIALNKGRVWGAELRYRF